MSKPDIVILAATRTPIGSFGGSLKDVPLSQLATLVVKSALKQSGAEASAVGHLVMGNVIVTEPKDVYLSRIAAMDAGLPPEVPAFNVNRLCGTGLQAVVSAAQSLALGDCGIAIAAGAESMSRSPYLVPAARWGARMGDAPMLDFTLGALHDPFDRMHMGVTAENVAAREGITRRMQDELSAASQRRAANAIAEGRFRSQITPVTVNTRKGSIVFDTDEHVRRDVTVEQLAKMKPVFQEGGTVTAGNASGINDGAAAIVLATGEAARQHHLKPIARLIAYGHAGVEPKFMGLGPIPASRKALACAGLTVQHLDVIESNEAFAAQACAVARALDFDPAKVNPNGSGISLGHPIAATGAILVTKAIYELQRTQGRYALVTMCIGGGQGIAAVLERI
jgi:acetyl-CoA C-acetyltransferase